MFRKRAVVFNFDPIFFLVAFRCMVRANCIRRARIKACQGNDFQWYCPLDSEYEIKRVCTVIFHTLYNWNVRNNFNCFMVRYAYVQRFYTFQSDYLSIINHVICTSMTLDSHAIAAIQSYFGVPIYLSTRRSNTSW